MKILLNGLQLSNFNSGVQYYCKHLYEGLKENPKAEGKIHLIKKSTGVVKFSFTDKLIRIILENVAIPFILKKQSIDIFHSPNYVLPFRIKSKTVLTVHDLITFDFPKLCQLKSVVYFRLCLVSSVKRAKKIIVVSEKVKTDLLQHIRVSSEKISVIHLGISSIFKKTINGKIPKRYDIDGSYILFVGNLEPKKNLIRLIHAYNMFIKAEITSCKLVIAGKNGWKYKSIFQTVKDLDLEKRIIFTGYIPEQDLPVLYSMAELFVFPSIYEGFGIPPLEAMACETPVIASNTGALPETTGGNCILVNPYSIDEIAQAMLRLIMDNELRNTLIKKGKKWAEYFTWQKTAQKTLEVYNQLASEF